MILEHFNTISSNLFEKAESFSPEKLCAKVSQAIRLIEKRYRNEKITQEQIMAEMEAMRTFINKGINGACPLIEKDALNILLGWTMRREDHVNVAPTPKL